MILDAPPSPPGSRLPGRRVRPNPWRRALAAAAALAGVLLVLYWPAVDFKLLALDDPLYTTGNPLVSKGLHGAGVSRVFSKLQRADAYIPVTYLTFMADVELFGMAPRGFHLMNIALHAADMALLLLLLWRMTGALGMSAIAAALVGLHPMRVESVAWVAERKDVLSLFFFLLSLCCYLRYVRTRKTVWHGALLLSAALGMLAKPMLVTLPALLLVLDYWPLGRFARNPGEGSPQPRWKRILALAAEKIPLGVMSLLASAVTVHALKAALFKGVSPVSRVAHSLSAYFIYLYQTFWPRDLVFRFSETYWDGASGTLIPASIGLALLTAVVVRTVPRRPYLTAGWSWYLIALFPVGGIVPVGSQWISDRYTFLPHVGLAIAVSWSDGRSFAARSRCRFALVAALLSLLVPLSVLTRGQLFLWKDGATLFARSVERYPEDDRYRDAFVTELVNQGEYARARGEAERLLARAADPRWGGQIRTKYLTILERTDGGDAAFAQARRFLLDCPDCWRTRLWLAKRLYAKGDYPEAAFEFRAASTTPGLSPADRADALECLGIAAARMGQDDAALASFKEALREKPDVSSIHYDLARVLARRGDRGEALAHFRRAIALDPDEVKPRIGIAELLLEMGDLDDAVSQFDHVARLVPGTAESLYARGRILEAVGIVANARSAYEAALTASPIFPETIDAIRRRLDRVKAP